MTLDFVTNQEIVMAARRNLSDNFGHYSTGLVRVLEILKGDIINTLSLLCISRLDQLNPTYLEKVPPVGRAHEMSAFPHMPGGQLL